MKRWVGIVTVVLAAGLLAAGCGGGTASGPPAGGSNPLTGAPPGEVEGGKVAVNIQDLKFDPEEMTIPAGTTVVFTNADHVPHTIELVDGPPGAPKFDTGPLETGSTTQQVFKREGTYEIEDPDRPTTKMTIEVERDEVVRE